MCTDTVEWWKIWRGIDFSFQNWHKKFDKFWLEHCKVSKIYTLMVYFSPKRIMFDLKKYREVIFHDTREWAKFEEKLTCGLGNNIRNLASFHQSTWKSQNLDFYGVLLSKVENPWAWNLQESYVLWQRRMMQNLKNNWLVGSKLTWGI